MSPRSQVWRAADRPASPWRNGGGVTREVAREPVDGGEFDWRISLAEVAASGPFSTFEDVDRVIVLLEGPGMELTVDGVRHDLRAHQPFAFDGGSATSCQVPAGPTRDLNVMTRRGRAGASVEIVSLGDPGLVEAVELVGADPLVLLVIHGSATVNSAYGVEAVLGPLDAMAWPSREPVDLSGAGLVAAVRVVAVPRNEATLRQP